MFTVKWVVNTFVTVFITMVFIYIIKKVSAKYQIPVISTIAEEV